MPTREANIEKIEFKSRLTEPVTAPAVNVGFGALKSKLGALETKMPAIVSTIILPAATKGAGIASRLLVSACERLAGHLGRRTAIACLHDLDDRALRDIGIRRFQIEAAVDGLITFSAQADEETVTAVAISRERRRAPTLESPTWS